MEDVAFTSALLEDDSKSSYPNSTLRNETTLFNSSYSKTITTTGGQIRTVLATTAPSLINVL